MFYSLSNNAPIWRAKDKNCLYIIDSIYFNIYLIFLSLSSHKNIKKGKKYDKRSKLIDIKNCIQTYNYICKAHPNSFLRKIAYTDNIFANVRF